MIKSRLFHLGFFCGIIWLVACLTAVSLNPAFAKDRPSNTAWKGAIVFAIIGTSFYHALDYTNVLGLMEIDSDTSSLAPALDFDSDTGEFSYGLRYRIDW